MNRKLLSVVILTTLLIITAFSGTARASDTYGYGGCSQPGRLAVGSTGRVTYYPNLPNRIRSYPSFYGNNLGLIPVGGTFYVLGGPQCDSGLLWWQVNYNGKIGWTAEGDGYGTYWLEPLATARHRRHPHRILSAHCNRA